MARVSAATGMIASEHLMQRGRKRHNNIQRSQSGCLLRRLRRTQGITQEELSLRLGVSRGAIAQWETGRATFAHRIESLAEALGVSKRCLTMSPKAILREDALLWSFRRLDRGDQEHILQVSRQLGLPRLARDIDKKSEPALPW